MLLKRFEKITALPYDVQIYASPAGKARLMMSPRPSRFPFMRMAFSGAALFALVMASLPQPPQLLGRPSDKVQHIIAFVVLTLLARAAYPTAERWKIFFGLAAFGVLIEAVQTMPSLHRDASLLDWLVDSIAVAATLGVLALGRQMMQLSTAKTPKP